MRTVQANDPRSPSVQIADDIRSQIESGELAAGTRLPSGRTLARDYGVALMTAQAALQRLRDEKLLYASSRGYFVSDPDAPVPTGLVERVEAVEAELREVRARLAALEARP